LENARKDLEKVEGKFDYIGDPYQAAAGSHAIALMTPWDLYRQLDYQRIFDAMQKPAFIFDGRNILDHPKLRDIGFQLFAVGKPDHSNL
jgi:UDPglucose 6-dehydrogenase